MKWTCAKNTTKIMNGTFEGKQIPEQTLNRWKDVVRKDVRDQKLVTTGRHKRGLDEEGWRGLGSY